MLEKLSSGLRSCIDKITRLTLVDEKVVEEVVRDIQRILLSVDVDVKLVFNLCENIRKRSREPIPKGLTRKEQLIKILYEELTDIMGRESEISAEPKRILMIGLFGCGKTSTTSKLARFYQKKGLTSSLICCDTFRPAAYEQLQQLSAQVNVPFYGERENKNVVDIIRHGLEKFSNRDIIIVDSSGRDALDNEMINEIKLIEKELKPDEIILVIPADIGQAAMEQTKAFKQALNITSVIVTKLDATAKGGGALTACAASSAKIKFITVGERLDDIEQYNPKRFVARLIGFGDLETLLEKVKEITKPELAEKIITEHFDLNDFCEQIDGMQKIGPMEKILDMIGLPTTKIPKDVLNVQESKMKKWKHILKSMTKQERSDPEIINSSRIKRIAKGSGSSEADVIELITSYKKVKKMIKLFKPSKLKGVKGFDKLLKGFKF